jgi:hypothetical protein
MRVGPVGRRRAPCGVWRCGGQDVWLRSGCSKLVGGDGSGVGVDQRDERANLVSEIGDEPRARSAHDTRASGLHDGLPALVGFGRFGWGEDFDGAVVLANLELGQRPRWDAQLMGEQLARG